MVRFCLSLVLISALTACGGGGGGGEIVSQPAGLSSGGTGTGNSGGTGTGNSGGTSGGTGGSTPPPTEYTINQTRPSSSLKTFNDGVHVYRLVDLNGDVDIYDLTDDIDPNTTNNADSLVGGCR